MVKTLPIKRVYDTPSKEDGFRVLIDRLWPQGLSKEKAQLGDWLKDIAPTTELRKWFGHDPKKWDEFQKRYTSELEANTAAVGQLKELLKAHPHSTLVYAARDEVHNDAVVIAEFMSR